MNSITSDTFDSFRFSGDLGIESDFGWPQGASTRGRPYFEQSTMSKGNSHGPFVHNFKAK